MDNSRVDNLLDLAASRRPTSFLPFVEITQVLVTSSCLKRAQEELCKEHGLNAAGGPGETSVWLTSNFTFLEQVLWIGEVEFLLKLSSILVSFC